MCFLKIGVNSQCTPEFDKPGYQGNIIFTETGPSLAGQNSGEGIFILVGCSDGTLPNPVTLEGEYKDQFHLTQNLRAPDNRLITLVDNYNLVSSLQIKLTIKACVNTNCNTAPVTIYFPFNANGPHFNQPFGQASIPEDCSGDCLIEFSPSFSAADADGDQLTYSILPFTDHANLFSINENSPLEITYKGSGVSENTVVTLLVKVEEVRPAQLKDSKSEIAVVKVSLTTEPAPPTTTESTTPECDDKNKKLYFIIMIVLASVLGGLLILLVLGFICFKCCCRSSSMGVSGSRKSTIKNSGIRTGHATYKSFSEMVISLMKNYP